MSDADDSVIQQLEAPRKRARREPRPRRPAQGTPAAPALTSDDPQQDAASAEPAAGPRRRPSNRAKSAQTETIGTQSGPVDEAASPRPSTLPPVPDSTPADAASPLRLGPDEPITNYAVRVRRSLDDLVAWRLAELRRQGARTTKVELTEMLLWELSANTVDDLERPLAEFRQHAPR